MADPVIIFLGATSGLNTNFKGGNQDFRNTNNTKQKLRWAPPRT